jgi:hypothetical protein
VNLRICSGGFRPGPLQVNAEAGDDEEEKDADVAERTGELDHANGILKDVVWNSLLALVNGVIQNDAESGGTSKRIDATQALRTRESRWGISH